MTYYKTFKRSCTDWKSFSRARKITVSTGLTYAQAAMECRAFNANLSRDQIKRGTKLEFTEMS